VTPERGLEILESTRVAIEHLREDIANLAEIEGSLAAHMAVSSVTFEDRRKSSPPFAADHSARGTEGILAGEKLGLSNLRQPSEACHLGLRRGDERGPEMFDHRPSA
jgi:hypothetical protein